MKNSLWGLRSKDCQHLSGCDRERNWRPWKKWQYTVIFLSHQKWVDFLHLELEIFWFSLQLHQDWFTQTFLTLLFRDIIASHPLKCVFINYKRQNKSFRLLTRSSAFFSCAAVTWCTLSLIFVEFVIKDNSLFFFLISCHHFLFALLGLRINLSLIKQRPFFLPFVVDVNYDLAT